MELYTLLQSIDVEQQSVSAGTEWELSLADTRVAEQAYKRTVLEQAYQRTALIIPVGVRSKNVGGLSIVY